MTSANFLDSIKLHKKKVAPSGLLNFIRIMKRCLYLIIPICITIGCQEHNPKLLKEYSKIVFLSNRDAQKRHFDIFTMDLDGSQQINLTKNLASVRSISNPQLSPDGKTILFLAIDSNQKILQLININDGQLNRLTDVTTDIPQPQFSPDGSKIVYVSKIDNRRQIHAINNDGSNKQNLSANEYDEFEPNFSPSGTTIVYVSVRNGKHSICSMNIDGSRQKMITDGSSDDRAPNYSPDGSQIVFSSFRDGDSDIYIMKSNGKKKKIVFNSQAHNTEPQFSPDGRRILFLSNHRGMRYRDIVVLDLKTDKVISVTKELNYLNQNPHFSPDGKKIVFESVKFNDAEIYLVDSDGQNLTNLTNHNKWDCSPAF